MPELLEYHIAKGVRAFSTYRHKGHSKGNYASFNVTHYCGDDEESVSRNKKALCEKLSINEGQLFLPHQTHGEKVLTIDDAFLKLSAEEKKQTLEGIDAIITNIPGICIGISTADCVPLLLFDPNKQATAAIHAGWRGLSNGIIQQTVLQLREEFNSQAKDIKVVIGPSISLQAFEVGEEVYQHFEENGFDMGQIARKFPSLEDSKKSKWHIDLWAAACLVLEKLGIELENIHVAGICTYQEYEQFFSARRLGIQSGRIFNGIMLSVS